MSLWNGLSHLKFPRFLVGFPFRATAFSQRATFVFSQLLATKAVDGSSARSGKATTSLLFLDIWVVTCGTMTCLRPKGDPRQWSFSGRKMVVDVFLGGREAALCAAINPNVSGGSQWR